MPSGFHDIVEASRWQTIQSHFSQVLKVTLRTVDKKGNLLTRPSIHDRICKEVVAATHSGMAHFNECFKRTLQGKKENWKEGHQCPLGFYNFVIRLKVEEKTVAYLLVGPVIVGKPPDLNTCKDTVKALGIKPEVFMDAVGEMKTFSFYGIRSVVELLYDIGLCVCQLGYQNAQLKGLIPRAPIIANKLHDFYQEKLLSALLEVSCDFSGADRGSVMLLDERNRELYIKTAKGLTQEIIDKTRLKLGEGLAGIVAQEKEPLLINKDVSDERILKRLNNPKLKNAIILPLKVKGRLLGVLSVASSRESSDAFSLKSVETIDKLAELVEATLADFPRSL